MASWPLLRRQIWRSHSTKVIGWLLVLSVIGSILYAPGIDIQYYEDDFDFVFDPPAQDLFYYFFHKSDSTNWYRPVEATILSFIQQYYYLNTIPIHILGIFFHIVNAFFVFIFLLRLTNLYFPAVIGSLFMIFSQANVHAVLSNDTLSQLTGTLFGFASIFLLYIFLLHDEPTEHNLKRVIHHKLYVISIVAFGISLFSKETSISFFPLLLFVIAIMNLKIKRTWALAVKKIFIGILPYIFILFVYLIIRILLGVVQPHFGHAGRYNFHIGINILKNSLMLLFAMIVPTSSVDVFISFRKGELYSLLTTGFASLVFICCTVYGLWNSHRRDEVIFIGVLMIGALFPMVMMDHVSELYAYNSMPFASILVGIGLWKSSNIFSVNWKVQTVLVSFFTLLLMCHITAIQSKISLMEENGERATALVREIGKYIQKVPNGGELLLLNRTNDSIEYSVFLMKDFNVLKYGEEIIKKIYNRNDIKIRVINEGDLYRWKIRTDHLILFLDRETTEVIKVYKEEEVPLGAR